jgi:putative ABC transport system permease protein
MLSSLDRKLLRDIAHLRGQLIAVILVVACGIASYVGLASVYRSLEATRTRYYDDYRFADLFASLRRAPESIVPSMLAIPGVAEVQARVVVNVALDIPGLREPATGHVVSIPESRVRMMNDIHIRSGRYIEPGRDNQVIIGEAFAEANGLSPGDTVGAILNGRWKRLEIVGIGLSPEYVYEVTGFLPDNKRYGVIWMGRDAISSAFDMTGAFNDLAVRLSPDARPREVIAMIDRMLERYGTLGAFDRSKQLSHHLLSDQIDQIRVSATIVPLIFLGVTAFLVNIVLTRLVAIQRDQIALLKAFGYSNADIALHFSKFALVAVLAGTLLGCALGWWFGGALTGVYAQLYRFPLLEYDVDASVVGFAVVISGGSAMVAALAAVFGAVRLAPAEAMRPQLPARFRPGLLERIGFQRFVSTPTRIIIRNLERNPLKSALSSLGISISIAVLVSGRYSQDSLEVMMDNQFRVAQREDMTIQFVAPRPARARQEIRSLPGVIDMEVFRMVPVRLRARHRTRQLQLTGLEPGGDIHRVVDGAFREATIPTEGLLLSAKLAEILGVDAGDSVGLELLEGKRRVTRVAVAALVEELFGTSAYIDIAALNRLMNEGESISGAYLSVDRQRQQELYDRLKKTPAVAATTVTGVMLESFDENAAEGNRIFMSTTVILASVVAFGIVYNSARISLSERGRELSSLRVLGFTRRETAYILLGEQALIVLLAIPVGIAMGYGISLLIGNAISSEMFRIPLVISRHNVIESALTIVAAAVLSGLLVRRRLYSMDIIEVLKTRE